MNSDLDDVNTDTATPDESIDTILSGKRVIDLEDLKISMSIFEDVSAIISNSKKNGRILVSGARVYNPFQTSLTKVKANLDTLKAAFEGASTNWKSKYDSLEDHFNTIEEPLDLYRQTCNKKDWKKLIDEGLDILLKLHKLQDKIDKLEGDIQKHIEVISLQIRKYSIGASELTDQDFTIPEPDWLEQGLGKVTKQFDDLEIEINQAVYETLSDENMASQFKEMFFKEKQELDKLHPKLIPLLVKAGVIEHRITLSEKVRQRLNEIEPQTIDDSVVD